MRETLMQVLLGAVALAMLGASVLLSGGGQQPAVLEASARFSLEMPSPGVVRWQLRAGDAPEGAALRVSEERITSRGDQLRLAVEPGLDAGARVASGQPLARLVSARQEQQVASLQGELSALQARRQLLSAGSRDAEIAAARQAVRVADAELRWAEIEQARVTQLASRAATSTADRQQADQELQIRRAALALARAQVAVAEAPARPEAVAEVEARLAGVTEQLQALDASLVDTVHSPLAGILETRAAPGVLDVLDTDPLIARFPLPQRQRAALAVGDPVRFFPDAATRSSPAEGTVAAISAAAHPHDGRQVFWVSVTVPNPSGALRPGTLGTVKLPGGLTAGWL